MHRILLSFSLLVFFLTSVAPGQSEKNLLKNGNFETFVGDDPSGWGTTNIPNLCVVVSRSTRRVAGDYSVKCEVKDCFGTKIPGMITQKKIPVSGETLELSFSFLMKSVGEDVGFVTMIFQNKEGSTIRMCEERLTTSSGEFAEFKKTFPVPDGAVAGELKIALLATSEDGSLHLGSSVLVDRMRLIVPSAKEQAAP
ncbi:MAG: hypothetical protein WBD30_09470 [Bacteroidota bacterium]